MTERARPQELKNTGYEIFIAALSVLSILNLVLVILARGDGELQYVLKYMNALFSVVFLGDFAYRLATAESRSDYFFRRFGWADLLASLPYAQLKFLRVFRLLRVYRLLAALGGRTVLRTLIRDRAGSALATLLLLGILVLQFGSLQMLRLEQHAAGANITTASDALWYTLVTISTVGYGDQFPVTGQGRVMGAGIIIVGVGIFGTFTGYLANFFLSPRSSDAADGDVGTGVIAETGTAGSPAAEAEAATEAPGDRPAESDGGTLAHLRALLADPDVSLAQVQELLAERSRPPQS